MNNLIKSALLCLSICFSVFCFCFLNTQSTALSSQPTLMQAEAEMIDQAEQKKGDTYFIDLYIVAKTYKLASRIFSVF